MILLTPDLRFALRANDINRRAAARELHPDVAVLRFLTAVEQVGLHRPVPAGSTRSPWGG